MEIMVKVPPVFPIPMRASPFVILMSLALLSPGEAFPEEKPLAALPLSWLDPFAPPDEHYEELRPLFQKPQDIEGIIQRLLRAYQEKGDTRYLIWSLSYTFLLWQSVPQGEERIRVSLLGGKIVEELTKRMPDSYIPAFWGAVFMGTLGLSRGVLNTLQLVPEFIKRLKRVEEAAPRYFYGSASLLLAKMYIKLPPFPLSLGNLPLGMEYLEKARPYQEKRYALWYVVKAEGEYLLYGKEKAFATLAGLAEVCPVDVTTRYTYEMAMYLSERFREAVESGTYDKYLWDPLLEPITPLLKKQYNPPRFCREAP